ncbi:hypothetical protein I0C86_01205 [Plantactinospora sp. S1510]|uniref:Guanylate kinase-like domain-containing protein n=1 Tax=Plantactinospora alkalitolerans TaxID=2789879 RepID=A0ABS0GNF2_9ACTN|nr:hypothetical protein [Plantactinospora alkalitolerans]MBF9127621.1 hypothetical protein [Plantactinospora alkalitolerans]
MSRPYVLLNMSGPYGVGKDTILNSILRAHAESVHRVSTVTTRPSSPDADPSYRSVSQQEFNRVTASGQWVITHQIGGQVLYGTSLDEIDKMASGDRISIHSVYPSDEGAGSLRKAYGNRLYSIGVLASKGDHDSQIAVLRNRLLSRGRDEPKVIDARLRYQADAIDYLLLNPVVPTPDGPMRVFDKILINDDIATSEEAVQKIWEDHITPTLKRSPLRPDFEIMLAAETRVDFGGGYFNSARDLESVGEPIDIGDLGTDLDGLNLSNEGEPTYRISKLFRELNRSLEPSKLLFGLYERGIYRLAPYIYDEERLFNFEEQVARGTLSRVAYFAVYRDIADEGLKRDFIPE